MTDYMGKELEIKDLVISMKVIGASGILGLFEIVDIYSFPGTLGNGAELKILNHIPRYKGDIFPNVHRTSDQISKIHDEDAMLFILAL